MSSHCTSHDVLIVGAGPAGVATALHLARVGRSVLLVDSRTFPREKVCGEGIMPHGVARLDELGLLSALEGEGRPFYGIRYRLPGGQSAEAEFPSLTSWSGQGLAVRRRILDLALVEAAAAEPGLDLRLGCPVRSIRLGDGERPHSLTLDDDEPSAPVLIGADGCHSGVRQQAGLAAALPRRARFAVRGHFEHADRGIARPLVEVFMGPHCELYLTPVDREATGVILTVEAEHLERIKGRPEAALREALRATGWRFAATLADAATLSPVAALGPLGRQAKRAHADGLLLVGDAAGALDPITGEGISIALGSARLAAEQLQVAFQRGDFSAARLRPYTHRRAAAVRELAAMTALVLFLSRRRRIASHVVGNLRRFPETFAKLLGITAGAAPVTAVTLRDGLKLVVGV